MIWPLRLGVEVACPLVGQRQPRPVDEGTGERYGLLLAARKFGWGRMALPQLTVTRRSSSRAGHPLRGPGVSGIKDPLTFVQDERPLKRRRPGRRSVEGSRLDDSIATTYARNSRGSNEAS